MKFYVNRKFLVTAAGAVWIAAGANILRIGLVTWREVPGHALFRIAEATAVFVLFFTLVFLRLYRKHTRRIHRKQAPGCPFSFFDAKGWLVMALMIVLGISVRRFGWLPERFISVFYTGLAAALILTGVLFLAYRRKLSDDR